MSWFEQLETLLANARLSGRKIESRSPRMDDGTWAGGSWTDWKEIGDGWEFCPQDQFRFAASTRVRPYTLAELTEHLNKWVIRFEANGKHGQIHQIVSVNANGARLEPTISGRAFNVEPRRLAAEWHFVRDGVGDKSWPPCGVVEEIPAGEIVPAVVSDPLDRINVEYEARMVKMSCDYADSVAACLRAVGLDPIKDEAFIRSSGSKPSDAIRRVWKETRTAAEHQQMRLRDLIKVIEDGELIPPTLSYYANARAAALLNITDRPDLRIPNQPEPIDPRVVHFSIYDVAKDAALRASTNAALSDRCVPPELLFGPIVFALWDAFGVKNWREPVGPVQVINESS